ncbi:MAG TPA: hypothetical protein VNO20_09250 [Solirubrobacterales bacterium]|nr:hypothetical protein [Solirubrobacterales bacterium]
MTPIDPGSAREFLESIIAAFSVLGGGMACFSGYYAAQALAQRQPPEFVAQRINEGLGEGFKWVSPFSIVALIIVVWT